MKIIYVGAFRFPYFDAASARVLNVGKSFRVAGHDVEYIAMGGKYIESHRQSDGDFKYQSFPYMVTDELDSKGGLMTKIRVKLTRGNKIIKELEGRDLADALVIAYNPGEQFLKKLISLSHTKGFKLAVDLTEWYDNNELSVIDWIPYRWCMKHTMKKIRNKIVISSFFDKYYSDSNNIVIPATCDPSDEKWLKTTDRVEPYDGVTLIYAGNPAKKDMVHTVINAVNHLSQEGKKIRFLLLGISREEYLRKYLPKLDSDNLTKSIVFLGKVSQNDVPAYYKHADYMILLRENNRKSNAGFPTKFAEAMTSGTPVIANPTSDIGKYIENGINGYILENEGYECVKLTMVNICNLYSPQLISRQKKNALRMGCDVFDYRNYSKVLNSFIRKLS